MAYWLIKSEPFKYSWDQLLQDGKTHWDGVRNYQARQNLQAMRLGDLAFFYHSNEGKEIVGIVEIVKEYYPDPSDISGKFGMVDVKPIISLACPVSLVRIKNDPSLAELALIRQARLSVQPVDAAAWTRILALSSSSQPS